MPTVQQDIIIKIALTIFEATYKWLKNMKQFTKTEELNIENAIVSIKIDLKKREPGN